MYAFLNTDLSLWPSLPTGSRLRRSRATRRSAVEVIPASGKLDEITVIKLDHHMFTHYVAMFIGPIMLSESLIC